MLKTNQNFQGKSFRNQNLTGADFSSANIRGTDFSGAILRRANFNGAKTGQSKQCLILVVVGLLVGIALLGIIASFIGVAISTLIFYKGCPENLLMGIPVFLTFVIVVGLTIWRGLEISLIGSVIFFILIAALIIVKYGTNVAVITLFGAFFIMVAMANFIAGSVAIVSGWILVKKTIIPLFSITALISGCMILKFFMFSPNIKGAIPEQLQIIFYAIAISITISIIALSIYISWRVIYEDSKYLIVRLPALTLASLGATSFRDSDLTDADFTNTNLKYTDFRNANLTRTCWLNARQLDLARINQTYLENSDIRKLVVDKYAEKVKFDNIKCDLNLENATLKEVNLKEANLDAANLKGVTCIDVNFDEANLHNANLESAKLQGASLMGADLSQANFKNADLSGAKLVRTQLYEADLTGANLTGAFIQDWGISDKTKLDQIKCEEIFMQLPTKENKYDPCRKPDETDEYFQEGDFIDFITPLRDTLKDYQQKYFDPRQEVRILDLRHRGGIDSLAAAIALKELTERYPKAGIEVVALQGGRDKIIILQIKVNKDVNHSQISTEYREKYREIISLPNQQRQSLLANVNRETNECIRSLGNIIDTIMTSKQIYLETDINFLGKKKILFLAANPQHQDEHRLQVEIREIQQGLERAKRREQFEIIPKWAVSLDDLRYYLLNENPQIIHFSGYGVAEEGLAFESKDGQTQFANPLALAKLFELFKDKLECVFLNACYSEPQAKAISQHIDYVIAINQQMSDPAAIKFAVGFYDALGAGRFIEDAFKFGCIALDLDNLPESSKPVIITKNGDYSC